MVMGNIFGMMADTTRGNGETIRCMGRVSLDGLMDENTEDSISRIRSKGKACLSGVIMSLNASGRL